MASGAATAATVFAALRFAVGAFLAPKFYFIFFCALDAPLAHLPVVFNLGFRKLSVLPEDDIETESDDAEAYKYQCREKYFHP